jgi:hypothetical protein
LDMFLHSTNILVSTVMISVPVGWLHLLKWHLTSCSDVLPSSVCVTLFFYNNHMQFFFNMPNIHFIQTSISCDTSAMSVPCFVSPRWSLSRKGNSNCQCFIK